MAYLDNTGVQTLVNKIKTDYALKTDVTAEIAAAIGDVTQFNFSVVESLPLTGQSGVLYLVLNSGSAPNSHNEYVWVNGAYELIGQADLDLSGYLETENLVGDTTYTVVSTDSQSGNTTVTLSADAIALLTKADTSVQTTNTISDAEILAMFNSVADSVTISGDDTVAVGSNITLTATTTPANTEVAWSSNDDTIATVDDGVVTGVGVGEATITAEFVSDSSVSATKTITVTEASNNEP